MNDERINYLIECLKDDQYAYFEELKEYISERFDEFSRGNPCGGTGNPCGCPNKPVLRPNKRIEALEKQLQEYKEQQERIIEMFPKIMGMLSYSEGVQQREIDRLWTAIRNLGDEHEQ